MFKAAEQSNIAGFIIDKCSLSQEQSLLLARNNWRFSIFNCMRLKKSLITPEQVKTIIDGVNPRDVSIDDALAVLNLRNTWQFLFDNLLEPLDLSYLVKLNGLITRNETVAWGKFRADNVKLPGTYYTPPAVDVVKAEAEIRTLLSSNISETEKALDLFSWATRACLFWAGNIRTAFIAANKLLLESGSGMLLIPEQSFKQFFLRLYNFYDSGKPDKLKQFLNDCISFKTD